MGITNRSEYQVHIQNKDAGIDVVANLPEEFAVGASSEYEARSGFGSHNMPGFDAVAGMTSGHFILQDSTWAVWVGTSPIQFQLTLLFDAESNSKTEVMDNLNKLLSLALPVNGTGNATFDGLINSVGSYVGASSNGILSAPGPTWMLKNSQKTSVRIGKQYYFDSLLVTSANLVSESRLNAGYPIAGAIEMTFQTPFVYDKADFAQAAGIASYQANASQAGPSGR